MKRICIAVAAIALPFLTGCTTANGREARPPQPVRAQAVEAAPVAAGVRYSATIEAYEQVTLAFKASGYVDDLLRRPGADGRSRVAQPGDAIARGTVLARVRDADYQERVGQGQARLREGEAGLTKARLDLERARALFASESLVKPELDAAQAAFDAAEARVLAATADLELARSSLRDTQLVAPSTGILLERRIEVGSLATPGTVGFVLGDLSAVKARFGIPDSMVAAVKPGDRIGVTVEAAGVMPLDGRVTAIAPAADPQSRVFDVEITIPNAKGDLRPGMIGTVAIGGQAGTSAIAARPLAVPLTAVVRSSSDGEGFAVVVLEQRDEQAIARRRRVELGEVLGNVIVVTNGLSAGERIVVSGATLVSDGDIVRVLP